MEQKFIHRISLNHRKSKDAAFCIIEECIHTNQGGRDSTIVASSKALGSSSKPQMEGTARETLTFVGRFYKSAVLSFNISTSNK